MATGGTQNFFDQYSAQDVRRAVIDHNSLGDNTIIAGVTGKKIRVLDIMAIAGGATTVRFESGASGTALTGQMSLTTNTGFAPGFNPVGHFETAAGELLNMELGGAQTVDGWVVYILVDADGR
jgi:hypothetical protein